MNKKIISSIIDYNSFLYPESSAVEEGEAYISYKGLNEYSNSIANCLLRYLQEKGQVAGVYLASGINYVSSIIGINKAGGIFMPLEIIYPLKRLEYLLSQVNPKVILTDADHKEKLIIILSRLEDVQLRYIITVTGAEGIILVESYQRGKLNIVEQEKYSVDCPQVELSGEDSNYLIYTSGSTGFPKVIEGMHKSLSHFMHWEIQELSLASDVRVSQLAPLSFDASFRDIFVPLVSGGTLCIPDTDTRRNPAQLINWLTACRISVVHTVPSLFRLLTKELKENKELVKGLSNLKYVLLAGEALYSKDVSEWRSIVGETVKLVNLYGPSETTLIKTYHRISEIPTDPHAIIPLGNPLSNTLIIILKNERICEIGEIGEIYIKTPFRSKGYYKQEQLTQEKFIQNPLHNEYVDIVYKTGDLGKYLADRSIAFVGRQDSQVKIRGNRVELSEVEYAVLNFEGIDSAVVLSIKQEEEEDVLCCYYISNQQIKEELLRQHLMNYLPEYMHPSYYIRMEEFPLNLNGKIDKRALPTPALLLGDGAYEGPVNDVEEKLEAIWKQVLNVERIGRNVSFFKLGVSSLKAIQVISRIYKEFGVLIKIADIFEYPTIAQIGGIITKTTKKRYETIEPLAEQEYYEVSHAQRRLWILDQLHSDKGAHNIASAFILKGKVDIEAFNKTFLTLIERHEILRTTFFSIDGIPKQKVHHAQEFNFKTEIMDCRLQKDISQVIIDLADEEANAPFDLSQGPLVRAKLIFTGEYQYLFLLTMHHIISDGWSINNIIKEIIIIYEAIVKGEKNPLTPLKIQYKDFTYWQNKQLEGEQFQKQKRFWKEQFLENFPVLEFPTDFSRPKIKTYTGDRISFNIHKELTKKAQDFCLKNDTTFFIMFFSAVSVLLYKMTGQKDFIIGSPSAGRGHKELEDQIGFYINILPLRIRIGDEITFLDLLLEVKKDFLAAYDHQIYPFDKIVEDIDMERSLNRTSLFDVMVQTQVQHSMDTANENFVSSLTIEEFRPIFRSSKFDLTFNFTNIQDNTIRCTIEYNTDIFLQASIERLRDDLIHIFEHVSENPLINLSEFRKALILHSNSEEFKSLNEYISSDLDMEFE